jgi:hypothetical protein
MMDSSSGSWLGRVTRKLKKTKSQNGEDAAGSIVSVRVRDNPRRLQKRNGSATTAVTVPDRQAGVNELGEYSYSIFSEASTLVERTPDHTEMIHGLAHHDSFDSLIDGAHAHLDGNAEELQLALRLRSEKHERMIQSLPSNIWRQIAALLTPADAAHLSISSKTLSEKLGNEFLQLLALPENHKDLIRFLNHMDRSLPDHLLCFPCGKYHYRINKGHEKLMADYVNHPLYVCPKVFSSYLPRTRLAHGRVLPYSFIQLAIRHSMYSPDHGLPPDALCRRWKDPQSGWSHSARYMIHDGRLLLRVRSQVFANAKLTETAERHLLYEREEYTPYFSVCAHWRDGELMKLCKCALSHIPEPPQSYARQLRNRPALSRSAAHPNYIVRMCDDCRPARRCPECPTEYLIEVNLAEDKTDPVRRFKHALVVTRWSDLGDGSSPTASPEYCAISGINSDYDSFSNVGRRAVAGIFESKMNGAIPGQRMISLNPKNKKLGENGHGWY